MLGLTCEIDLVYFYIILSFIKNLYILIIGIQFADGSLREPMQQIYLVSIKSKFLVIRKSLVYITFFIIEYTDFTIEYTCICSNF